MSYSLKNKNKRRGFKDAMAAIVPTKIDFRTLSPSGEGMDVDVDGGRSADANVGGPVLTAGPVLVEPTDELGDGPTIGMTMLDDDEDPIGIPSTTRVEDLTGPPTRRAKTKTHTTAELVPPSRMKNLPRNVIVTTIDVEADLWPETRQAASSHDITAAAGEDSDPIVLDYTDPSATELPATKGTSPSAPIEWDSVDSSWDSLSHLPDVGALQVGQIIAWQVRVCYVLRLSFSSYGASKVLTNLTTSLSLCTGACYRLHDFLASTARPPRQGCRSQSKREE